MICDSRKCGSRQKRAFDAPIGHVERDNDGGSRSRIRSIVSRIMELGALAPLEVRYSSAPRLPSNLH